MATSDPVSSILARLIIPEELCLPDEPGTVAAVVRELRRGDFGVELVARVRATAGGSASSLGERDACLRLIPNLRRAGDMGVADLADDHVVRVVRCDLLDLDLREPAEKQSFVVVEEEFLSGGSLEDRVARKDFSDPQALQWMREIARGVASLHSRGLRGDLSLAGVRLSAAGAAKLVSWGVGVDATMREAGKHRSSETGSSDDVWAMGLVFLQLWTRRTSSEVAECVGVLVEAVRVGSDELGIRTHAGLAVLIGSMLSRDDERHCPKPAEVEASLEALIEGAAESAGGGGARVVVDEEEELRRKAAAVSRWRDAKDVRSLVELVASPVERPEVRVLASEAVRGLWESQAGATRREIEVLLETAEGLTAELQSLRGRIEAAKKTTSGLRSEESARERKPGASRKGKAERPVLPRAVLPRTELFRLLGHSHPMSTLLAHPTRPLLVSGSEDKTVRVWDLGSRGCIRMLAGHKSDVLCLALDPAGRRIASGSNDFTVRLWDFESGACLRTLEGHENDVHGVAWDASGALVASGSADKTVRVWDAASGALRRSLKGHSDWVRAIAAHPTDDLLASGSDDFTARVWRWSSGTSVFVLHGHTGAVSSLAASASWLVSGSYDQTVRVWSWASGECVRVLDGFAEALWPNSLAWRDSTLVTLEGDGRVRVWDTLEEDPGGWACLGSLASKASFGSGVALVGGGRVACAAARDAKTIAMWGV